MTGPKMYRVVTWITRSDGTVIRTAGEPLAYAVALAWREHGRSHGYTTDIEPAEEPTEPREVTP